MKKLFYTFICLVVGTFPLYAQGARGKALVEGSKKISEAASKKGPAGIANVTGGALGNVVNQAVRSSTKMPQVSKQPKISTPSAAVRSTDVTRINAQDLHHPSVDTMQRRIEEAKEERARIERDIAAQQAAIQAAKATRSAQTFSADFGRSVLLAPMEQRGPDGDLVPGGYSVTVIKNIHEGEEEIFGVIATHTIPTNAFQKGMLGRRFKVQVEDAFTGKNALFNAEVVAFSPSSMLDISLVKFDEEVEYVAKPLEISDAPAMENEILFPYGYGAGQPIIPGPRTVQANSWLSVRTNQTIEGDRQGFCGSPLLDATGKVKAIHTGTKEFKNVPDVSYGTHAKYIQLLIDAYHNEGKAPYDLEIDGQTLAHLNVDEYVDYIGVYNTKKELVAQKNIETGTRDTFPKFSESSLRRLIQDSPDAAYLLLRTKAKRWDMGGRALINVKKWNGKKNVDPTKRENWYNLQTRQITSRPDGIRM